MIEYLYVTSDLNLFLILSAVLLSISILALFVIKWLIPLHFRYQENAVIGCTSALVIVIYGVLAGFATSALITNSNNATTAMENEANAVSNMYRESQVLREPYKRQIQDDIKHYTIEVLEVEWPLMNQDKTVKSNSEKYLQDLTQVLSQYKTTNNIEALIIKDLLTHTTNLYDARQQRIQDSYVFLGAEVWVAIIIGTLLTLCVSYIFGVHFYLHIFIVVAAALMATTVLFLLIGLDKPFVGEYNIGPDAIKNVMVAIKD